MMWKIVAGKGNAFIKEFIADSHIAIGWSEAGDYTTISSKPELIRHFAATWPEQTSRQVQVGAGQAWRFLHDIMIGDSVTTYDPDERIYHVGIVCGEAVFSDQFNERLPIRRQVKWEGTAARDSLSQSTRNSLGAIMTLFKLPSFAASEIKSAALGLAHPFEATESFPPPIDADIPDPYADLHSIAFERVKDRILSLQWDDMQDLVAALLRALGYRTIVSPKGSDRGRDIIASRDGFGFERPRIVVEVKHRKGTMGAPEIRSFLQTLHHDDRGLYVSTGGFSKEAHYQAENANNVTHLMSIDGLAQAILDQYDHLDEIGKSLLPLNRLYWPQSDLG
jgi:restriction system protein